MTPTLRIVFMGTPEFAVPCLSSLSDRYSVVAAYTQPDRPAGRGRESLPGPVKKAALARGIEVLQPASLRDPETLARLAGFAPDLIVVAAYGLLLPKPVLELPRHGCLNVHPSLLPRHRGPSPIPWAILEGDSVTGVSMMLMDAGLDTGPVLDQVKLRIDACDTALTLRDRLASLAAGMLPGTIDRLVSGALKPRPQDNAAATYSRLIKKEDGKIDWSQPAAVIERRVRAFQPWPGCFTGFDGRTLKISEAVTLPAVDPAPRPGEVVAGPDSECPVGVGTGEGILGLIRVQLEGKREVTAAEFLRGQPRFMSASLC